jgi:hypothetical protein
MFVCFSSQVGSYVAVQWLANLVVAASALGQNCTRSETEKTALYLLNLLVSFGLSVIGTNLLCHRYLVEKARVMIKMCGTHAFVGQDQVFLICFCPPCLYFLNTSLDDANDPSVEHLERLEGSLVWETRSLYIVAVAAPAFVIYKPVGMVLGGLGVLVVVVMVHSHILLIMKSNIQLDPPVIIRTSLVALIFAHVFFLLHRTQRSLVQ